MSFAFAQLQKARETLAEQQQQLDAQKAALDKQEAQIDAAVSAGAMSPEAAEAAKAQIAAARGQLAAAQAQLDEGKNALADNENQLDLAADAANEAFAENQKKLDEAKKTLEEKQQELEDAKQELEDGRQELEDAKQELKDGWADYYTGKAEAEQKISDAEQELADAKQEITDGDQKLADAEQELADGEQKLADAEQDYRDGEDELEKLENPDVFVLDRSSNVGYACFESDSGIVDGVADVFPIFFFLVAALVCVTTMNRMVEEQRTQIGVLKALGYSEHTIMAKYMFYSGSAALTGCVAGFALGTFLFPKVIWYAYGMLYKMDSLVYVFDWKLAVISVIVSLLCSIGTTFVSVRRELTEVAAELMRPKTPKAGKRVFLEYIPFVWKRLKFLQKVSMRNIFRYKKRFFMMVAGISGCSALLVTGFGVRDSVTGIVTQQYTQIQTYDIGVTYSSSVTPEQKSELESKEQDGVEKSVFVAEKSMDLVGSEKTKSVSLIIADPDSDMTPFVNLHTEKGVPITFPKKGEAVISAKVADELGIKTGDTVTLQDSDMKTISVTVSGLCENFVYNYVYLSADTYEEQMKTEPEYKNAFVCVSEGTDAHLLGTSLMAMSDVAAVNISQDDMERFSSMMGSMDLIVVVIILCAAGLAFIVLYNLTNINITERVCEIATIEVLGFYENETAAYVFRENTILTFLGALAGLVLGVFLHRFVMSQIVVDMVAFDVHVKPVSFVYSVVLTLVFTWFVDRLMRKKIDAISMTESLKSVD